MAAEGTSASFLGVGWSFPVGVGPGGGIAAAEYEESVRQAVWIVLATAPGERAMRPDFGCGMHDLVFAVNDSNTAGAVADSVREALLRFEPRIELLDVEVSSPSLEPTLLLIRVDYRVRATNNDFNLVYPFSLEQESA